MFDKLLSTTLGKFLINISVSYPVILALHFLNGDPIPPYEFLVCCCYSLAGTLFVKWWMDR